MNGLVFETLPALPYSWVALRQLCGRVRRAAPVLDVAGVRVALQFISPDYLPGGLTVQEHTHAFYEAHLLLSGDIRYLTGEPQRLGPGHFFLQPPKTPHAWQVGERPCLDINFGFVLDPEIPLPLPARWPLCHALFWELALLLHDADREEPGWSTRATAHLTAFFSRVFAALGWPASPALAREEPQLLAVIEQHLLEHLGHPLTLDGIAAALGLNRRSLCRYFRAHTGTSVMDYLRRLRLQSAIGLLLNTDLTTAAIARQVGMPETSYFCRCFRRHTGLTPQAYRRGHGLSMQPSILSPTPSATSECTLAPRVFP